MNSLTHVVSTMLLFFLFKSTKCQNQIKCLKTAQLISSPFIKSIPPYPCYIKQYIGIQRISIHNEKWFLWSCNLLFHVRCFLRIAIWCETPWSRGKNTTPHCKFDIYISSTSTYNSTLHFGHLKLILVCFLWNIWHHIHLPFWGQSSLFCTFSQLMEGVGLPCGVVWGWSPIPPSVNLTIRDAQGQDYILSFHCVSVSASSFWLSLSSTLFLLHSEYNS